MKLASRIIQFILAAIIVVMLGGLAGWYYFVHRQISDTAMSDAARGTVTPSFGGSSGSTNVNAVGSTGTTDTNATVGKAAPRLWHVTRDPVAGYGYASSSAELYFAEVASGNILEADPATSATERLTNTLVPKAYEAHFAPDGAAVLRFDGGETIETFAGTLASTTQSIDSTSTPQTLQGLYLAQNIASIAVAPAHTLFSVLPNPTGGSVIVRSDWKGANQKKIFSSALSEWEVRVLSDGTLVIAQKPSDSVAGYAYTLSSSGALSPYVSNIPGLTILPRIGGARIFGSADQGLTLYAQTAASASPTKLSIQTSADKCVWSNGASLIAYCAVPQGSAPANYLDARATGEWHSTDAWYTVDVSSGTAEQLFVPDPSVSLDVTDPMIDAGNTYIAFTNAADKSLWMLRIAQ